MEKVVLEKHYPELKLVLPSVVHAIEYEKQIVLDILLHKDQMFKAGQELQYQKINCVIKKKVSNKPVTTERLDEDYRRQVRKVRYFCEKLFLE